MPLRIDALRLVFSPGAFLLLLQCASQQSPSSSQEVHKHLSRLRLQQFHRLPPTKAVFVTFKHSLPFFALRYKGQLGISIAVTAGPINLNEFIIIRI